MEGCEYVVINKCEWDTMKNYLHAIVIRFIFWINSVKLAVIWFPTVKTFKA